MAIPFAILGLALDEDFFEDWGWLVGSVIWLACSAMTGRILSLPLAYVLFSAVAGGVAGLIVMLATSHTARADSCAAGLRGLVRQLRPEPRGAAQPKTGSRGGGVRTRESPAKGRRLNH